MRAVGIRRHGGVEVLETLDVPIPEPRAGEVLVKVLFAGLNFVDVHTRRGEFEGSGAVTGARILGREGAGEVVSLGAGVTGFQPGDRVAWCITEGSYAEFCAVPAWRLGPVPSDLPLDIACALQMQGATAHYLATSTFPIGRGDIVLVHSAAAGVGRLLVQIAKARGANVIATVGSTARIEAAKASGANLVIARDKESFRERVAKETSGTGCHVVYDAVGRETFADSIGACRRRGMVVLYGGASGPVDPISPTVLAEAGSLYMTRPHLPDYMQDADEVRHRMADVLALWRSGTINIEIARVLGLDQAKEGHDLLEARTPTGKLLLKPSA